MPESCENWLGLVNSCIYYALQTQEIYEVLPYSVDFKAPVETVPSKCSFIWNKGAVSVWNYLKVQK